MNSKTKYDIKLQAIVDQAEEAENNSIDIDYLDQATIDQVESIIDKASSIDHLDQATIDQVESTIDKASSIGDNVQATIEQAQKAIDKSAPSETTTFLPAPTKPQKDTWAIAKRKQPLDPKLKATVDKIERLTKQNPEFDKMLRERLNIQPAPATNPTVNNERIDQIYEYCIEKVVRRQAEDFYADFPIKSLADSLVGDFCRMEYFRRKDNFCDFSLAVYQQLESITNCLTANDDLNTIAKRMWWYPAYVKIDNNSNDIKYAMSNRLDNSTYCIADLLFMNRDSARLKTLKNIKELYAVDKMRIVFYFVGYNTIMPSGEYSNFVRLTDLLYKIYQCRNTNHRGGLHSSNEGTAINQVLAQKSVYYFNFLGALTQYVEMIKKGLGAIAAMKDYALGISPRKQPILSLKPKGKIDL